jgi:molecular chaperone IbpA
MRNFDLTPLWRSTVGFDRLSDLIDNSLRLTREDNYPSYNIDAVRDSRLSYVA